MSRSLLLPLSLLSTAAVGFLAGIIFSKRKLKQKPRCLDYEQMDYNSENFVFIPVDALRAFCVAVFRSLNVPQNDAEIAAEVLVSADLRGIDSHGVARLHSYFEVLEAGLVNPTPKVQVIKNTDTTAIVDGDNGLGLVVGPFANQVAIDMANVHGSGWVSVRNTNHYGIAGYYSMKAMEHGCIGFSMTNTTPLVAPCFGLERMLGTNPIAVAFPGLTQPDIVIDLATSAAAYGKIEDAHRLGAEIPSGWCIDINGNAETSPENMKKNNGIMLPIGFDRLRGLHKGYCLSAMVDILCAVLSGANWGPFCPPFTLRDGINQISKKRVGKGIGHFFGALKISGFRDVNEFRKEIDNWTTTFRNSKAYDGKQVLIPGDPERKAEKNRKISGIPIKKAVLKDLRDVSQKTGVPFDY